MVATGFDDGDCCICTCFVSPTEACGTGGEYDCIDPDADCDAEDGGDDGNSSQGSAGDEVVPEDGDDNSSGDDDDGAAVPFDVDDGSDGAAGKSKSVSARQPGGGRVWLVVGGLLPVVVARSRTCLVLFFVVGVFLGEGGRWAREGDRQRRRRWRFSRSSLVRCLWQ